MEQVNQLKRYLKFLVGGDFFVEVFAFFFKKILF
jgi:hypothetical protein